jgi:hypothetical protein
MDVTRHWGEDLEGCICPQDYVKTRCPVHDPDGTYYAKPVEPAPCLNCRGAVDALREIRPYIAVMAEQGGERAADALERIDAAVAAAGGQSETRGGTDEKGQTG